MAFLPKIRSAFIFYRPDNKKAQVWALKLASWLKSNKIGIKDIPGSQQLLFVLGGDGTILEAVRRFHHLNPIVIGMNLGSVGFLASVREEKKFKKAVQQIARGEYWIVEKMMLEAIIKRNAKEIAKLPALNEILIQNPLGMVRISVSVAEHSIQEINGTGVLVSTPTGSTAYNLSAHGPLVMPNLDVMIMSEVMDHSIPTPSIVLDTEKEITLKIEDFRKRELLSLTKTREAFDVILSADGETIIPLQKRDVVTLKRHKRMIRFAELEKNYFLKSLREKFTFR